MILRIEPQRREYNTTSLAEIQLHVILLATQPDICPVSVLCTAYSTIHASSKSVADGVRLLAFRQGK